jgi:hypothetical protein
MDVRSSTFSTPWRLVVVQTPALQMTLFVGSFDMVSEGGCDAWASNVTTTAAALIAKADHFIGFSARQFADKLG